MELASREKRLAAAVVDILSGIPVVVLGILGGTMVAERAQEGMSVGAGAMGILGVGGLYFLALIGAQIFFLTTRGQSLGKMVMKVKIVKAGTGENGGFVTNVLIRGIANGAITGIPFLGAIYALVDILFIFKEDRRCCHDLLAGTIVVNV